MQDVSPHHTADQLTALLSKRAADLTVSEVSFLRGAFSGMACPDPGTSLRDVFGYAEEAPEVPEVEPEVEPEAEHHESKAPKRKK